MILPLFLKSRIKAEVLGSNPFGQTKPFLFTKNFAALLHFPEKTNFNPSLF